MSNKAQFFHNVKKAKRQRLNAIPKQRKYLVWIGGTHNAFDNLDDAEWEKMEWEQKGYDDIFIETINEY